MHKILIIDDSRTVRTMIRSLILLDYPDAEIEEVENGKEGFGLLTTHSFNLIITDLEMDNGDGISFLAKMQNSKILKKKKIIIFSSAQRPPIDNPNIVFIDKMSSRDILKAQIKLFLV